MPRNSHEPTLARHWELLKFIPSRQPGLTARDLCDRLKRAGHDVSKRTIERDLSELSIVFPLMCNNRSIPFGWHWKPGARFDIPGISLAEAVSLGLLEDLLRQLAPPALVEALGDRFAIAHDKLRSLPGNPNARWTELVRYVPPGLPFQPPAVRPDVLQTIHEALIERKQIRVTYTSAGASTPKELLLHPIALIQQGARPYLLAGTFNYPEPVLYAVQRICSAQLSAEPGRRPKGFSLDQYLADGGLHFGVERTIVIKARLADELARLLAETPLSADQKITVRAGVHTLTATVPDSWQLQFWILSQGSRITVNGPPALRREIHRQLREAAANYESRP